MSLYPPPSELSTEVFTRLPDRFRVRGRRSPWLDAHQPGREVDCFLEGPSFDRAGNLYVVDIPFGRVFRVSPAGDWELVTEYDGWPNGLRIHRDGRIFIADYKRGIVVLDPESGAVEPLLDGRYSEGFKGCNDLVFAANGDLYFTDQGQTGLHDPTGRVYRYTTDGRLERLIGTGPSPNGLVLDRAEAALFVAMTRSNCVWRLPLMLDGGTSKVGLFVQLSGGLAGPDGLALDEEGRLFVCHAGNGTVWVFSPLGEPVHRIRSCAGLLTTNIAFGGPDNRALFITESDTGSILRAELDSPGRRLYSHM
jgi:gluconolactonase